MLITGLNKLTLLDFPGHLACIIFTGGCNVRCGYCHNAQFVLPEKIIELGKGIAFETVVNFLKNRQGKLDGVVICGGEPTVHPDLPKKLKAIKELGFKIKLDTNGFNPKMLEDCLRQGLLDYIAMDIKDALPYRPELVGVTMDAEKIRESIKVIRESGVNYEFRSTILPSKHDEEILGRMVQEIKGSKRWVLQKFRSQQILSTAFSKLPEFSPSDLQIFQKQFANMVEELSIRY
ncbi:anaerobic ribonucleoside-triphosphate reductase activating protein [Candidatus Peregrinibacteria bacterium]|nr:anaerobic ribonucleoside-triphosphate reductase activating protein [Candidatus Peregrinibacteria bacterium]